LVVQLKAQPVRVAEVEAVVRSPVRTEVLDAGLLEPLLRGSELLSGHRDRQVLQAADRLGERWMVVSGKVEEAQQVAIANVEEEVARPDIVTVLDQFDQ